MSDRVATSGELATQILVALIQKDKSPVGQAITSEVAVKQVADAFKVIYASVKALHQD